MNREQFDHLIRAVGSIWQTDTIIVIGSQAILGQFPMPRHPVLTLSAELDVIPKGGDEKLLDIIDGILGEESYFHETFQCYAQGVSLKTPRYAPRGWLDRCVPYQSPATEPVTALCMEVHDLAIRKYAIGREKDLVFLRALVEEKMVRLPNLLERLKQVSADRKLLELVETRIRRDFSRAVQQNTDTGFDLR